MLAKRDGLLDQLDRLFDGRDDMGAETVTVREYLTVAAAENGASADGNGATPNTPVAGAPPNTPVAGVPGAPPNGGMVGNKFEG